MTLIDTHTHINYLEKITPEESVKNALENGVEIILVPAASPEDVELMPEFVKNFDNVYGMLGVHPEDAEKCTDDILDKIREYSKSEKIVAIGEIGLDYYWDKEHKDIQKDIFIKQVKLANELNLPISVHDRDAHKDTFDILKEYNKTSKVVMHCFSGSVEFARECLKEGWYIAIGGVVTFKSAYKMQEVAKAVPLDRLLLETDAPYLTPVPYRGKENQPAYVKYVAEEIAKLRGITFEEVAQTTTNNAKTVFNLLFK